MLLVVPSQVMDTCYGENRKKISRPRKCGCSLWNFVAILYRSWDIAFLRLYFRKRRPSFIRHLPYSRKVSTLDHDNSGLVIGISLLSCVSAKTSVFHTFFWCSLHVPKIMMAASEAPPRLVAFTSRQTLWQLRVNSVEWSWSSPLQVKPINDYTIQ